MGVGEGVGVGVALVDGPAPSSGTAPMTGNEGDAAGADPPMSGLSTCPVGGSRVYSGESVPGKARPVPAVRWSRYWSGPMVR